VNKVAAVRGLWSTAAQFQTSRLNALRHGILSRYTVLPWEDATEYQALVAALIAEHAPVGATEEHLVEELAGIFWRKRRLRLAEAAAFRRGLTEAAGRESRTVKAALVHLDHGHEIERVVDSIRATEEATAEELADVAADEAMTARALAILKEGRADAQARALAELRDDTRAWWNDALSWHADEYDEGEPRYEPTVASLIRFLEARVNPWYEARRTELANRPLIREQAFGEALDPDRLERLSRYEVHLDRKLERTVCMLLRLRELRRSAVAG
jgi:hypothetical protein